VRVENDNAASWGGVVVSRSGQIAVGYFRISFTAARSSAVSFQPAA
jgi:hypothetical protein